MKPMLAAKDPKELIFPCYVSAKIDGIRAIVKDGILLSRTLKPIPNEYTQRLFGLADLDGLDGELAVGPPNTHDLMQRTTSGVMSEAGEPDVTVWVFDYWTEPNTEYHYRWTSLLNGMGDGFRAHHPRVKLLPHSFMRTAEQLAEFEREHVAVGFEGVMTRKMNGLYKYGRSTAKEQHLVKHKRFSDGEAVVIGFEERMHNANEATTDALGHTKRSSHQENKIPTGTLGALIVQDLGSGIQFNIGTGFDDATRKYVWDNRTRFMNSVVSYKHFEGGVKTAPRFPVFKSFRDRRDMEALRQIDVTRD
jgi:DNA ligase-1